MNPETRKALRLHQQGNDLVVVYECFALVATKFEDRPKWEYSDLDRKDPIFECLNAWLLQDSGNVGREVTANELFNEFRCVATQHKISFNYKSPLSFAKQLQHTLSKLELYFDIEAKQQGQTWSYSFSPWLSLLGHNSEDGEGYLECK